MHLNERNDYQQGELWDASLTIEKLDKLRKRIPFNDLQPESKTLLKRLCKEYRAYFLAGPDIEAEKALCAHPMLVTYIPEFFVVIQVYKTEDIARIRKIFVKDMTENFCVCYSCIGAAILASDNNHSDEQKDNNNDESATEPVHPAGTNDMFMAFKHAKQQTSAAMAMLASGVTGSFANATEEEAIFKRVEQECEKCYLDFRSFCHSEFNVGDAWSIMIEKYPTKEYIEDKAKWDDTDCIQFLEACRHQNFCRVGHYFNVMSWWNEFGTKFRHVFPSAIVWLSRPASNAFQERVFSLTSWFDSNRLMRWQSNQTFKLQAMECMMRGLCEEIKQEERKLQTTLDDKKRKMYLIPPTEQQEKQPIDRDIQAVQDCERLLHITASFTKYNKSRSSSVVGPTPSVRFVPNEVDIEDEDKVAELMEDADDIVLVDLTGKEDEDNQEGTIEADVTADIETIEKMAEDNNENKNDPDNNNKDNEVSDNINVGDSNEATTSNVESTKKSATRQYAEDDSSDDLMMIQMSRNNEISLLEPDVRLPYVSRDVVSTGSVANTEEGVAMIGTAQAMSPSSSKKSKASTPKKKKQLPVDDDKDSDDDEEEEDYYSVQSDSSSEREFDDGDDDEKSASVTKKAEQGGKSGGKKRPMTPKKGTASPPKPKRKNTPSSSKKASKKNEGKQKARKTPPCAAKT